MELKNRLKKTLRNSIRLNIEGKAGLKVGSTRFGGQPDLPDAFEWPYYEGEGFDGETKNRPLSFIAQFNLEEIAAYDTEKSLPQKGLLSFFYETSSMKWGFDPKDEGCAKVFYFEEISELKTAEFPTELESDFRFPPIKITAKAEDSYQDFPDFILKNDKLVKCWEEYDRAAESLKINVPNNSSKLLGWADIIQGNMTADCELVSREYYLGHGWEKVTPQDRQEAIQSSSENWLLLFQLDSVENDGFELMFSDCGRIYYYIRKEDLAAKRFDRVWLVLQCC